MYIHVHCIYIICWLYCLRQMSLALRESTAMSTSPPSPLEPVRGHPILPLSTQVHLCPLGNRTDHGMFITMSPIPRRGSNFMIQTCTVHVLMVQCTCTLYMCMCSGQFSLFLEITMWLTVLSDSICLKLLCYYTLGTCVHVPFNTKHLYIAPTHVLF